MLLKSIVSWINAEITLSQGRCDILNLQSPAKTDDGSSDRSLMVDSLTFLYQPVLHDWCNKGRGMCYDVCWMVNIKDPLLLIEKSSPYSGGSGIPLSR